MSERYGAVVVGSGPAGLAVVGNLLEKHEDVRICWVDRHFLGGRISNRYREVSSNTKASLILSFATALEPFKKIVEDTPSPSPFTMLKECNQEEGCPLDYAADMFMVLTEGLLKLEQVNGVMGTVLSANFNTEQSVWTTQIECPNNQPSAARTVEVQSHSLILCTGSSPSAFSIALSDFTYHKVGLDIALSLSRLGGYLTNTNSAPNGTTIGVIGSSHSAVTVLMNLYTLASTYYKNLRIKWFSRRPLLYAEDKGGWTLHDNTGLKGAAAAFAAENLEDSKFASSPVNKFITKIDCSQDEMASYKMYLPQCTHVIQAIGFKRDPIPRLQRDGQDVGEVIYDHINGGFTDRQGEKLVGLYGAGIAFPELVVDPEGNTEFAVGFWKFMKFLKRAVPAWDAIRSY